MLLSRCPLSSLQAATAGQWMKANLTGFGLQRSLTVNVPFPYRPMDRRLFQHFPLLTKQTDFLAKARVLFLNVLVRSRHQVIMLPLGTLLHNALPGNGCCCTHLFSVKTPTPKSDESCGRVKPLVVATRTASRRNASVYRVAI